jgi:nickel-dependent lactate racemase
VIIVRNKIIQLPYGEGRISCEVPEGDLLFVARPQSMEAIMNPREAIAKSFEDPISSPSLAELAEGSKDPCIVISDSTRPTPSGLITKIILDTLNDKGIRDERVKVVVASGLHRACTEYELVESLTTELLERIEIHQHEARDDGRLTDLGYTSQGTPLQINKIVLDSDLIIGDGYIEPHFFAGYTGGGKNILPGVAGLETIKINHGSEMIDHPRTRAGVLEGNPIYSDIVEGARKAGYDFSVNVTLNGDKRVSGIFSGDFEEAHKEGTSFLSSYVKVRVPKSDIVVTTNGGYPLDRDLYQAVKGMTVAESVAVDGGVIIVASECRDGVGHPYFRELAEEGSPSDILEKIRTSGFFRIDQWQNQILARIQVTHRIICVTDGVPPSTLVSMNLIPAGDMDEALEKAKSIMGRDPGVTVIPDGPSILPR